MTTTELLATVTAARAALREYHATVGDARDCTEAEAEQLRLRVHAVTVATRAARSAGIPMPRILSA
jgi:hypothetical protein